MHHPAQVSSYIKDQQRMASAGVRGHQPDKALLGFYASMEQLCSVARPLLNYISLSAIITATAQLWTTAQANSSFKPSADTADFELKQFYCSILLQLKPMLPSVGAQAVSNILWSSAKLGLSPDAFVPGMTDALAARLLQLTKAEARHQPNAQSCANFLWALATLGHEPADKGWVDAVCAHFAMLIKHHDESTQPNAQGAANFLWALATLGHEPADKGWVDVVGAHFAMLTKHHDESKRPNEQGAANVVWALATLGHEPADKGLVDVVCNHFVMLIRHHDARKQPGSQAAAILMWALATLGREPADKGLVDVVCAHFAVLIKHHDESKRPNAQGAANVLWALATLGHKPAAKGLVDAVCNQFAMLIKHHDESKRPGAQGAANVVWAVATLGHEPADKGWVDVVCTHFVTLIMHHDAQERPASQAASNVMWALGEMNHAPLDGVASAILERLTALCALPRQAPNAHSLSNALFACAVLRLKVKRHVIFALIDELLRLDRATGSRQDYCHAAHSLAVSNMLSVEIFSSILERLQPSPGAELANDVMSSKDLAQLHQALDFLKPLETAAAQQLQEMVTRLGPRPLPVERTADALIVNKRLCAALGQLGLAFTPDVPLSGYQAHAVLQPRDGITAPVILVTNVFDSLRNKDYRCAFLLCFLDINAMHGQKGMLRPYLLLQRDSGSQL